MREKLKKWGKKVLVVLLALVVVAAILWWLGPLKKWTGQETWQAVFLSNGQVYFGHMRPSFGNYVKLTDIYYLQVTQQLQPPAGREAQPDIRLVKLGGELHGPQDAMHILRDHILFWEDLKDDSRVVQGIQQFEAQR